MQHSSSEQFVYFGNPILRESLASIPKQQILSADCSDRHKTNSDTTRD